MAEPRSRDHVDIDIEEWENTKYGSWREVDVSEVESRSRFRVPVETGRQYVRNVRALAFDGEQLVAVHQLATPQIERMPDRSLRDAYGGGDREVEPIAHRMSIITRPGHLDARVESKPVAAHQPMALLHMPAYRDWLVAGQGNVWVEARFGSDFLLPHGNDDDPRLRCGADGLALAQDGKTLWLHCGLTRHLARIAVPSANRVFTMLDDPLAPSRVDAQLELGAALFNARDWRFSSSGMACASCHPEGRTDGLSWRLGPEILQTPILAGRVGDTAPYKWDGQDATLPASFRHTIQRLAGESRDVTAAEYNALAAYLDSLPAPLPRSVAAPEAAARGRALFEAQSCDACHSDPKLTDGAQHRLATRLRQVDTPSLIGLGHSRPYYHDGSAQDLWTLLTDKASVHDMADFSGLDDAQLRDLIAYLEGL